MNLIDTNVIVRSSQSGCWYGRLVARKGDEVLLQDARRLWRWWSAEGVSLSGVAAAGLHPDHLDECKIAAPVEVAIVLGVCEVLSTPPVAQASIEQAPTA